MLPNCAFNYVTRSKGVLRRMEEVKGPRWRSICQSRLPANREIPIYSDSIRSHFKVKGVHLVLGASRS